MAFGEIKMNKMKFALVLATFVTACTGREYFVPTFGSVPFVVYFASRYRGICTGSLVSRTAVITAAVCVTSPSSREHDYRPINVVTATSYRHQRRGIRVQVTKVLLPKLINVTDDMAYLIVKAPAVLILKRKVPDALAEIPLRAIDVDYKGEEVLMLTEECLVPGWHFFKKGEKIYPGNRFILLRRLRTQFMNIVKENIWCDALLVKYQKALADLGFDGYFDRSGIICVKDPDRISQPCHGNYGAPLVCRGRLVAMMLAPDAQWTNCTGFTNVMHLMSSRYLRPFMQCVSVLFHPDARINWPVFKKSVLDEGAKDYYDYIPAIYDKVLSQSESESSQEE